MKRPAITEAITNPDHLFIDGDWTRPSSTALIDVNDSSTEEVFFQVAAAQAEDVHGAVTAARRAFDTGPWPQLTPSERADWLRKIAAAWMKRSDAAGDGWTAESGTLRTISGHLAAMCAGIFQYYAGLTENFPWKEHHTSEDGLPSLLVREPVGVVAAIIPWNAPALLMSHKVAPALLAGCTVVVKASPEAPTSAYLLASICEEIGLPPGVINVITADRDVSELLVRHPGVDKVTFTGSTAAGRKIASICGDRIARCTLELGGKSPAIILDDYDVAKAAASIAYSAPIVTGQVCSSLTRLIVSKSRHDEFVDALRSALVDIKVGDPFDVSSQMGPLASAIQRDRVESYIEKGRAEGADLVLGGGRPQHLNRGYYVEPTIFANVDNGSVIAQDEIFGPVLCVIPALNEAHAIEIANDTIYGLNASVFTEDSDRAYAVGRKIRAGTVGHNAFKTDFTIAFGGFKQSGLGREGGSEGILPFLESKTMIFERMPSSVT